MGLTFFRLPLSLSLFFLESGPHFENGAQLCLGQTSPYQKKHLTQEQQQQNNGRHFYRDASSIEVSTFYELSIKLSMTFSAFNYFSSQRISTFDAIVQSKSLLLILSS